ncbi:alpha/beta hydrolase-fold protein [Tenacibaculum sp. 190524A05c]|uniref:alpha/beta hydrolase-fold protein n=1 Tax=Tenacibaculum platacis TaxID=3137852 RepID=UPI0031FA4DAB
MIRVLIFFLSFLYFTSNAQESEPYSVGKNYWINSKILKEKIEISIYLPENYKSTITNYPVLYILDGQRYFLNGVLYQHTLKWQDKTPDFIVVGIKTNNRQRRKLFSRDSKKFIQFLNSELVPYLENNYRTSSKRYLFGWEMAGGLAIEILTSIHNLFSTYFISSPTHLTDERLQKLSNKLSQDKNPTELIYVTLGSNEDWALSSIEKLQKILRDNNSSKLKWKYELYEDENHHSTPTLTMHKGLNLYFNDYVYLRFKSLKEFEDFGGIDQLKKHFVERGRKYDISKAIHKSTKHFLLLQAMKENDFESFVLFMNEFKDYYKTKTRDSWFNRYAQFYLKHNHPNQAIEILNYGQNKFPNSAILQASLGDTFFSTGNKEKARNHYQKALDLAIKNDDDDIDIYKTKIEQIK